MNSEYPASVRITILKVSIFTCNINHSAKMKDKKELPMGKVKEFFDDFTFHARVMPIIVLLIPIIILGILNGIVQDSWLDGAILSAVSLTCLSITSKIARNLGKEYEKLIKCDLVCHSVPRPKALRAFLNELEDKYSSKIKEFCLREKKLIGWQASNVKAVFENGEIYREILKNTAFLKGFMHGLYNRPSCSECSYKDFRGASDITIGDYWGIESVKPEFTDSK